MSNKELISFDCKRCSNHTLIKTCIYFAKRTDDFCEGFYIKEGLYEIDEWQKLTKQKDKPLEEGYEDIYIISSDDCFRTYADMKPTVDKSIPILKKIINKLNDNKAKNIKTRIIIRWQIMNLKEILEGFELWDYEIKEAFRND